MCESHIIADRYKVEKNLGRGGTAVVYQVLDTKTNERLALKQLQQEGQFEFQNYITELFEYEYYTLTQLSHPHVIAVLDYGKSEHQPYYTMELLDGGDLGELSPIPWRKLCSLLLDICSALSLLHSRRLVHRDLTPRNIRCTQDGRAKLIDFGALVPMGTCKSLVGTAPFTAPEVVNYQILDARTDLFALGATAYYALTKRNAYPARKFKDLRDIWRSRARPPSNFVQDIPKDLDSLILSLLNYDPMARPHNTAEVIERLSAIADIKPDEQLLVSQAYLSTPSLIGRDHQLLRIRKKVIQTLRGRGGAFLVDGVSGVGRSRFLDACVLEGKLIGTIVLRANARDSYTGQWGVVRSILHQLIDLVPELTIQSIEPYLDDLGRVFPELIDRCMPLTSVEKERGSALENPEVASTNDPEREILARHRIDRRTSNFPSFISKGPSKPTSTMTTPTESSPDLQPRIHKALHEVFMNISTRKSLMLAVDDIHKVDESSVAFIALISSKIFREKLIVIMTSETFPSTSMPNTIKLIKESSSGIRLRNLPLEYTEKLLGSIFGKVPHLNGLADRIQAISKGNPRTVIQLAQSLVDKGTVHYHAGIWAIPHHIESSDLPDNLTGALKAQIKRLQLDARKLAQTLALVPDQGFSFVECLRLTEHKETARLTKDLQELILYEILSTDGDIISISHEGLLPALHDEIDSDQRCTFHTRLAEVFESREEGFRAAAQRLLAKDEERAVDMMIQFLRPLQKQLEDNADELAIFVKTLPRDFSTTFETFINVSRRLNRSRSDIHLLQYFYLTLSIIAGRTNIVHLKDIINSLYHASGLEIYQELSQIENPSERLTLALERAQQCFEATAESERLLPPIEAIGELAHFVNATAKLAADSFDYDLITSIPSLQPLFPLSKAVEFVTKGAENITHLTAGRFENAQQGFLELLDKLAQPDRCDLNNAQYKLAYYMMLYGIGQFECSLGIATGLKWANMIESDISFQINAYRLRMLYHLRQGDTTEAELIKKRIEQYQLQNNPIQLFEGPHLFTELLVYAASDDLIRVKHTIGGIQEMVQIYTAWLPILHLAQAEYQRLRGDYRTALTQLDQILRTTTAGRHVVWAPAVGTWIKTLTEIGHAHEAVERGRQFLLDAKNENLGITVNYIRIPLSLAEANTGDFERAIRLADIGIESYTALNVTGVNLGFAYETRARIAILMGDDHSFNKYLKLCAEHYRVERNSALSAKYEKLVGEAREVKLKIVDEVTVVDDYYSMVTQTAFNVVTGSLTICKGPQERAQKALQLLVQKSGCHSGYLYIMQREGPELTAIISNRPMPSQLTQWVQEYLSAELEHVEEVVLTDSDKRAVSEEISGWIHTNQGQRESYHPLIIGHHLDSGFVITGLAMLVQDADQSIEMPHEEATAVSRSLLDAGDVTVCLGANPCQGEMDNQC